MISVARRPKIAIFDYQVRPDSAQGGCHLRMLRGLCEKYDFTVFAVEFDNPAPNRIQFVRIPAPLRPTILLSIAFHLLAPIYYFIYRLKHRVRFDLVERMEVFTILGSIAYVHFCHRTYVTKYLKHSRQPGLRGILLSIDHASRAYLLEPLLYRTARKLVVPSQGLARELIAAYPFSNNKIRVLPNCVDYDRLSSPPENFDRPSFRHSLRFTASDIVLVFVALGQFERKGLPLLIDAIAKTCNPNVKLLVVGGSEHWTREYGTRAEALKIRGSVRFVGMQCDVAPYLWAADAFCVPSLYETFLLVGIESAAAGLPLLVPRLNGVEDYLAHGENGFLIERDVDSISAAIEQLVSIGLEGCRRLGSAAQAAAQRYTVQAFVAGWDELIEEQLGSKAQPLPLSREETEHAAV
jgi:glycosyltransferase involved in cell wall biosynthesis